MAAAGAIAENAGRLEFPDHRFEGHEMSNDLRKTPRFVATEGVPARIFVEGKSLNGTIHNFSSTGFAIALSEDPGGTALTPVDAFFSTPTVPEVRISACISNRRSADGHVWLGCQITGMHQYADAYFGFLTAIMSKQGFLRSMATKPVKVKNAGAA